MESKEEVERMLDREIDPGFRRRATIIVRESIKSWKDSKRTVHLLDIGCGRGWYEQVLVKAIPRCKITGIDGNLKYLEYANTCVDNDLVKFRLGDATKLDFKTETFDGVICSEVIEHVENDDLVMKEIHRVLKPEGLALISVPHQNYPFAWDPLNWILERTIHKHIPANIWWLAGIWADHVRLYNENEFTRIIKQNNFKIEKIWRTTHFCIFGTHFLLYGVGKKFVERGFFKEFNRFAKIQKQSSFFRLVRKLFDLEDKKNEGLKIEKDTSYLNLVAKIRKYK